MSYHNQKKPALTPYRSRHDRVDTDIAKALNTIDVHAEGIAIAKNVNHKDPVALKKVKNNAGLRTAFATGSNATRIATNYLKITPPKQVFVYSIEMVRPLGLTVRKSADRKICFETALPNIPQLVSQKPRTWATDYDLIWSTTELFTSQINLATPVVVVGNADYYNECGVLLQVPMFRIFHIDTIPCDLRLFHVPNAATDRNSRSGRLLRGFNAFLTAQARGNMPVIFVGGNKGFEPQAVEDLAPRADGNPMVIARSDLSVSARPGIDQFLLNINTATSAFFDRQSVHDILSSPTYYDLDMRQATGLLKGIKVRINYSINDGWPRPSAQYRFIEEVALQTSGQNATGSAAWFANVGNRAHSLFPSANIAAMPARCRYVLVNRGSSGQTNVAEWYPAFLLEVVESQRFGNPLEIEMTRLMIEVARLSPAEQASRILNAGLRMFRLNAGQQQAAGGLTTSFPPMSTGTNLLSIPAQFLNAPTILYANKQSKSPKSASWDLQKVRFIQPAQLRSLPYLNLSGQNVAHLLRQMRNGLVNHGLIAATNNQIQFAPFHPAPGTPGPGPTRHDPTYGDRARLFLKAQQSAPKPFVLFIIIGDKDQDRYAYLKRVAELQLGIQTIFCVCDKGKSEKFPPQCASNIALKFNMRAAGVNHNLKPSDFAAIPASSNTIVIGADVTHPPMNASPGTPSIAGVVGSIDNQYMQFPGSMRLQRSRQEQISDLGCMVKERLLDWAFEHKNRLPAQVLFYRDGVSESQYDKMRAYEIPQIKKAFNWAQEYLNWQATRPMGGAILDPRRNPWPPAEKKLKKDDDDEFADNTGLEVQFRLTYVIVGKRHNTRFYAIDQKDKAPFPLNLGDNVRPGLVVDQVITHPHSLDFYLQSHDPIAGTGRSAHYFTLTNQIGLSTAELQSVTHSFCYAYSRATKGVSYCAPAYYADRLCDRGRAYLRHWLRHRDHVTYRHNVARGNMPFPQYKDLVKDRLRDQDHWRTAANRSLVKYGFARRNPWHPDMDKVMFYL